MVIHLMVNNKIDKIVELLDFTHCKVLTSTTQLITLGCASILCIQNVFYIKINSLF